MHTHLTHTMILIETTDSTQCSRHFPVLVEKKNGDHKHAQTHTHTQTFDSSN